MKLIPKIFKSHKHHCYSFSSVDGRLAWPIRPTSSEQNLQPVVSGEVRLIDCNNLVKTLIQTLCQSTVTECSSAFLNIAESTALFDNYSNNIYFYCSFVVQTTQTQTIGCVHVRSQTACSLELRWRAAKNSTAVTMVTVKMYVFFSWLGLGIVK